MSGPGAKAVARVPAVPRAETDWSTAAIDRLRGVLEDAERRDRRFVLGLVGAPGVGKSTVSERILDTFGDACVIVAMDGFHYAASAIAGTERAARRGAPDTFDAEGFVHLLTRIRLRVEGAVYAPTFDRRIEDPVNAATAIRRDTLLVVVEGNYLLGDGVWSPVRELLDEVWFIQRANEDRIADLIARHRRNGKSEPEARAWATGSDERNSQVITQNAHRADLTLDIASGTLSGSRAGS
ncbi:nucleoside/nucleotide kinase family protein [Okibacterium endophyticum]